MKDKKHVKSRQSKTQVDCQVWNLSKECLRVTVVWYLVSGDIRTRVVELWTASLTLEKAVESVSISTDYLDILRELFRVHVKLTPISLTLCYRLTLVCAQQGRYLLL